MKLTKAKYNTLVRERNAYLQEVVAMANCPDVPKLLREHLHEVATKDYEKEDSK